MKQSQSQLLPDEDGPVFREPWEAQVFSLVLALHEQACFSWDEWAAALAEAISEAQQAGDADAGDTYYQHCLCALEKLIVNKGLSNQQELQNRADAWRAAYLATPHGQAVELPTDS